MSDLTKLLLAVLVAAAFVGLAIWTIGFVDHLPAASVPK